MRALVSLPVPSFRSKRRAGIQGCGHGGPAHPETVILADPLADALARDLGHGNGRRNWVCFADFNFSGASGVASWCFGLAVFRDIPRPHAEDRSVSKHGGRDAPRGGVNPRKARSRPLDVALPLSSFPPRLVTAFCVQYPTAARESRDGAGHLRD